MLRPVPSASNAEKNWTDLYLPGDEFAKLIETENALTSDVLKSVGLVE